MAWQTWRVARSLDVLLAQLNRRYPHRSKVSDGSIGDAAHSARASDHNPDGQGIVRARDITHDPGAGVDIDRLSDELAASRDPRIKYVIANRLIMSGAAGPSPWRWVPYSGINPHTKHLHLSVVADARADDPRPWNLSMLQEDTMPNPADLWNHPIPDPFVKRGQPGDHKPAGVLLGWSATHAARALAEATAAKVASSEVLKHVLADQDVDVPALLAHIDATVRQALVDAVIDVDVTVGSTIDKEATP